MPSEVVFGTGASVKVIAGVDEVGHQMNGGIGTAPTMKTARFAGFRGDEAVGGEQVVLRIAAIAYVMAIPAP